MSVITDLIDENSSCHARIAELEARIVWLECEAQGVVMPERESFMAGVKAASDKVKAIVEDYDQRHGSTDPDTGTREYPGNGEEWVCCMLELIEDFTGIVAPVSLNAAPVQQPKCKTCDDNGRIGGPSFYAPDEGGEPCPDCSALAQQVSVPDGSRLVTTDWLKRIHRDLDACQKLIWANMRGCDPSYYEDAQERLREIDAMLAAAPAAPAADASDVLEQAMYALIGIGYHENSGLVHELRQSLAAHRAKGVV